MSTESRHLGACPRCGSSIPADRLLIEYETSAGDTAAYAECPACGDVVHPN